jgi:hypothetical protein
LLAIVFLVIPLGDFQPLRDKIDIPFGRSVVRLDDLQHARTEYLPWLSPSARYR